jgi:hypothetical protein
MPGQSGGATLIGGLLGMRSDLGCVVIGAGLMSYPRPNRRPIRAGTSSTQATGSRRSRASAARA